MTPLISAIIPTRNRPTLVLRAVRSVLAQTYSPLEIIVVVDGFDVATVNALSALGEDKLSIVALPQSVGGSRARNTGVQHARGEWVAFLDDDDEWLPDKLQKQIAAAQVTDCESAIVCSKVIARTATADFIWPENPPCKPYSEYLLMRSRMSYGEGLIQTSTVMAKRELLLHTPFRDGLRKHQDWDWMLRVTEFDQAQVVFVSEPLAIWTLDRGRARVSSENAWRSSYDWIRESKRLVTRRAYASFIATYVARQAAAEQAYLAFFPLLKDMLAGGSPRPRDVGMFFAAWLTPAGLYQRARKAAHARLKEVSMSP
jgi:glycosyltransferase involved in cell wall biosynthesis